MSDKSLNYFFDFEEWSTLAVSNPEKFERLRQAKIAELIEKTDRQRQIRLRGLQWTIDRVRDQHKSSSVGTCVALSKLMWKTVGKLVKQLETHDKTNNVPVLHDQAQADIIPFRKIKA